MSEVAAPIEPANRVYFPELDGLRFLAFALVYLFHGGVPQVARAIDAVARACGADFSVPKGSSPWSYGRVVVGNGWVGVQLFFLLSGYLITTLLLREEGRSGRIDLRAFWMRRILRIWPLYYLLVGLTFFVLPVFDGASWEGTVRPLWIRHLLPFAAFAGNWSMGLLGPVPYDSISILWSVCVEEQFYLICPLLLAWVRPYWRVGAVASLMAAGVAGRWASAEALSHQAISPLLFQYSTITQFDTLLSGVLLALLTRGRPIRLSRWTDAFVKAIAGLGALALLSREGLAHGGPAERTIAFVAIWAVGLAVVATSATGRGAWGAILRYPRLVWLGRISYGLYMFHELAFWFQRAAFDRIGWFPNQDALAPIAAFALTIGLASASYYGLERRFLRLKSRWSRVDSRPV